ncbi:MAG: efflux RND transporter periplasmic adaptor subunit [Planctomycetaceae bacterium]|nr:efflux RND transporter periplasmic adaptor subunit [Planctomycetaceae bacterium]
MMKNRFQAEAAGMKLAICRMFTRAVIAICGPVFMIVANPCVAQDSFNSPGAIKASETRIEIKDQVEVSVEVSGTIDKLVPSTLGGVVEEGQVIIHLDDAVIQAQVAEARAKAESDILIRFAEIKRDSIKVDLDDKRTRQQRTPGLFTEAEMRRLELEWEQAKAELEKAQEDKKLAGLATITKEKELKQFTRVAELSGVVTDFHKKAVGSTARPGDPIMTIVNLDEVLAVLTVSPDYEDRINVGDKVLLRRVSGGETAPKSDSFLKTSTNSAAESKSDEGSGEVFTGHVILISPTIKTDRNRSLQVHAVITNKKVGQGRHLLREGSLVESVIIPQ